MSEEEVRFIKCEECQKEIKWELGDVTSISKLFVRMIDDTYLYPYCYELLCKNREEINRINRKPKS